MALNNIPQNTDYGGIPDIPKIPEFKMPDLSKLKAPTVGANLGNTVVQGAGSAQKYADFNPQRYELGKTYETFPEGQTEMPLPKDYVSTRILPADESKNMAAGSLQTVARDTGFGGASAYDPTIPDKMIKTDKKRLVSSEMRDKVISGTPQFYQVDHVRPLELEGLDIPQNLRTYDILTHDKKTRIQAVPMALYNARDKDGNPLMSLREAQALSDSWEKRSLGNLPKFGKGDSNGYLSVEQAQEAVKRWKYEEENNIVEKPQGEKSGISDLVLNKIPKALESGSFIPFAGEAPSIPKEIIKGAVTGLTGLPYIPQQGIGTAGQVAGYAAFIPAFLFSFGKWIKGANKLLWGAKAVAQGTSRNLMGKVIVTKAVPATVGLVDKIGDSLGGLGVFQNILRTSSAAKGAKAAATAASKVDDLIALGGSKVISAVNKIPKIPEALKLGAGAFEGLTTAGILKGGATMATANLGASWYSNLYDVTDQDSIVPVASNFIKDFVAFSMYGMFPKSGNTIFNATRVTEFGVGTMASIVFDGADSGEALLNGAIFAAMGAMGTPATEEKILNSRIGDFYRAIHTPIGDLLRNELAITAVGPAASRPNGRVIDPLKFSSWLAHEGLNKKLPNNKIVEKKIGQKSYDRNYSVAEIKELNRQAQEKMYTDGKEMLKRGESQEAVRDFLQQQKAEFEVLFINLAANGTNVSPDQKRAIIENWIKNRANSTAAPTEYVDSIDGFNQGEYGSYPKEIALIGDGLMSRPDALAAIGKKSPPADIINIPKNSYLTGITSSGGGGKGVFKKQFEEGLDILNERDSNGYNLLGEGKIIAYKDNSANTRDQIEISNAVKQEAIANKEPGYEKLYLTDPENVWKLVSITENPKTGSIDIIPHGNVVSEERMGYFNDSMDLQGGTQFKNQYTINDKNLTGIIKDYATTVDGTPLGYLVVDIMPLKYGKFKTKLDNYHLQIQITEKSYDDGRILQGILNGKEAEIGLKLRENIKAFNDSLKTPKPGAAIEMPGSTAPVAPKAAVAPEGDNYMPEVPFKDVPETGNLFVPPTQTPVETPTTPAAPVVQAAPVAPKTPVPETPVIPPKQKETKPLAPKAPVKEVIVEKKPLDFSKPIDINKSVDITRNSSQEDIKALDQKANPTDETIPTTAEEKMLEDMKSEELGDSAEIIEDVKEKTQAEKIADLVNKSKKAAAALPKGIAKVIKKTQKKKHHLVSATSIMDEGIKNIEALDYDNFNEGGTLGGVTKRIKNQIITLLDEGTPKTDKKIKDLLTLYDKYNSGGIRGAIKKYDTFDDFVNAFKKNMEEVGLDAFDQKNGKDNYDQVQSLRHTYEKVKQAGDPIPSLVFTQNKDGSINYKGASAKGGNDTESTLFKHVKESTKAKGIEGLKIFGVMDPEPKALKKFQKADETILHGDADVVLGKVVKEMRKRDIFFIGNQGGVIKNTIGVYIPPKEQAKMVELYDNNKERYAVSDPEMLADMKKEGFSLENDDKIMQVFYTDFAKLGNNFRADVLAKRMPIINNKSLRNPEKGELDVLLLPETELSTILKETPDVVPEYIRNDPKAFDEVLSKMIEDGQEFYLNSAKDKIRHNIGASGQSTNLQGTTYETVLDKNGDIIGDPVLMKGNAGVLPKELRAKYEKLYGVKIGENTKIAFRSGVKTGMEHFVPFNSPENLKLPPEQQVLTRTISNDYHRYMFENPKDFDPSGSLSLLSMLRIPANATYKGRPVAPDIKRMFDVSIRTNEEAYNRIFELKEDPHKVLSDLFGINTAKYFFGKVGKMSKGGADTITINKSIQNFLAAKFQDSIMHLKNLDSGYFKFKADTGVKNGKIMSQGEIMMSKDAYDKKINLGNDPTVLLIKNPVTRTLAMTKMNVLIGEDYGQTDLGLDQIIVNPWDVSINFEADVDGDAGTAIKILSNKEVDEAPLDRDLAGIPESIVGWIEEQRVQYGKESPFGGLNLHQGVARNKYPKLPASSRKAMLKISQNVSDGKQKLGGTTNHATLAQLLVDNFGSKNIKEIFTVNGKTYEPKADFKFQDDAGRLIQMEVDAISSSSFSELPESEKNLIFKLFGLKKGDEAIAKKLGENIRKAGYESVLKLNKKTYNSLTGKEGLLTEIENFMKSDPKDPSFRHPVQELLAPFVGKAKNIPDMSTEYKKSADKYGIRILKEKIDAPDMTPKAREIIDFQIKRLEEKSDVYSEMGNTFGDRHKELEAKYEELKDMQPFYDKYTENEDTLTDEDKKAISWFVATAEEGNKHYNRRLKGRNEFTGFVDRPYDLMVPEHAEPLYEARMDYFRDPVAANKVLQTVKANKSPEQMKEQAKRIKDLITKAKGGEKNVESSDPISKIIKDNPVGSKILIDFDIGDGVTSAVRIDSITPNTQIITNGEPTAPDSIKLEATNIKNGKKYKFVVYPDGSISTTLGGTGKTFVGGENLIVFNKEEGGEKNVKENPIKTKVKTQKMIYRKDLKDNPDTIYLFGDNVMGEGFGGQAKEMRGEPNAVGIPTKKRPSMSEGSFFTDNEFEQNKKIIDMAFNQIPSGKNIIIPEDGLGTGLAKTKEKAPKTFEYLNKKIEELK